MKSIDKRPLKQQKAKSLWSDTRGDTGFVEWLLLVGLIAIAGRAKRSWKSSSTARRKSASRTS